MPGDPKTMSEEINDMLDFVEEEPEETIDEPSEISEEPTDEVDESVEDVDDVDDEVDEGEPSVEEGVEEVAEEEPEEVDELTELRNTVTMLRQQINDMAGGHLQKPVAEVKPTTPPTTPSSSTPTPTPSQAPVDIFEGMPYEDVVSSPDKFRKVIMNAVNLAQQSAYTNILRALPVTVTQLVQQSVNSHKLVDEFFKENNDLVNVRQYVGTTINTIASEHPDWEVQKVFEEAATRTRKALGLQSKGKSPKPQAQGTPPTKPKPKPAFAGVGSARHGKSGKKISNQQKQILDILP